MGREVMYLSEAKLRSFSLDSQEPARRLVSSREMEGKLETPIAGVSGRLGPARGPSDESSDDLQRSYDRLERVLAQLSSSLRAPRDIDDPRLQIGGWASFEREIKFGHFTAIRVPTSGELFSSGVRRKERFITRSARHTAPHRPSLKGPIFC
jgi:hypothetical protein